MKETRFSIIKYVVLVGLFLVTAVITFFTMDYQKLNASTAVMSEASLPLVLMQTTQGTQYNMLHGYTVAQDEKNVERQITPLEDNKKLTVAVETYGTEVTSIAYRVRDLTDLSLLEYTTVTDYKQSEQTLTAEFNIKNLIENNTIYALQIILTTAQDKEIYYYTSIISGVAYETEEKLAFAMNFCKNTMSQNGLSEISQYLEPRGSADASNYGKVGIHNRQSMVGWGELHPFIEGNLEAGIEKISSEGATIRLHYLAGAENESGTYDTYDVTEVYDIAVTSKKILYLADYNREVRQIFDSRNDTYGKKIILGIQPDTQVEKMTSENGRFIYFINQGVLWCYDVEKNIFTESFSYHSQDSDNIREQYQEYDIQIMNVLDNGDCDFLVKGYMNRGEHEGAVGVSQFLYHYEENTTQERLYVPLEMVCQEAREQVGKIAYVNNQGIFYLTVKDTLYAINLTNNETMVEVTGLTQGTYAVSKNGRSIAYSKNNSQYNTDAIRIFNMELGTDYEIHAQSGNKIQVIGYINSDFIYGIAKENDITEDEHGNMIFPMGKIEIVDTSYQVIKEYDEPGIYITKATVENLRLNLERVKKTSEGYEQTSIDQLINREENDAGAVVNVDTTNSANRLKEVVLELQNSINSTSVQMRYTDRITYLKNTSYTLEQ